MGTTANFARMDKTSNPEHPHEHGDNSSCISISTKDARNTPTSMGTTLKTKIGARFGMRNTPTSMGTTYFGDRWG